MGWRPETHTFHLRCGEATITLQDVSILLGLHTEGTPLIGQTNLDWAELCEELLGVRPQEGELQGSVVKLSWLAHHFSEINIHDGNVEQLQRFTRAWILRFIGGVLFVDKSSSKVSLRYLQFLRDFEQCSTYAWGPARDVQRHRLQNKINRRYVHLNPNVGMGTLHDFGSKENSSYNGKQITRTQGEVTETLQYMVSPQGRNTWTVDDLVPYVEKLAIISQEQERITEPVSSVETRGFDKRREIVHAEDLSQQMDQRGHGMYYTPPTFSQYPSLMYQYPFEGHDTDMSASEHSFGGVTETHPHFSWPTMTHSQQHDVPMATPNAPLGPQWDVPGAIPDMGDILGVDLRHEFSAEAKQEGRRQCARRNPDRQAQRWDRPYLIYDGSTQSISFLILVDFGRPFARIVVGSGISVHASSEGGIAASFPRGHHCAE
ncbi:Serine/threonine-protein phosphatase 7 long form [Glycine soja]